MSKRLDFEKVKRQLSDDLPNECQNCESSENLHIHHIVPLSVGGTNKPSNLAVLCEVCHGKVHGNIDLTNLASESKKKLSSQGKLAAGWVPLGYKTIDGNIVVDEEYEDIARLIYKWRYKDDLTLSQICEILDVMAVPTKRNSSKWTHVSVMKILKNPIYFGDLYANGVYYGNKVPQLIADDYKNLINEFNERHKCSSILRVFPTKKLTYCIEKAAV